MVSRCRDAYASGECFELCYHDLVDDEKASHFELTWLRSFSKNVESRAAQVTKPRGGFVAMRGRPRSKLWRKLKIFVMHGQRTEKSETRRVQGAELFVFRASTVLSHCRLSMNVLIV